MIFFYYNVINVERKKQRPINSGWLYYKASGNMLFYGKTLVGIMKETFANQNIREFGGIRAKF